MQRIAEMNHHVRNALQVIAYWSLADKEKQEVALVQDAGDPYPVGPARDTPREMTIIGRFPKMLLDVGAHVPARILDS